MVKKGTHISLTVNGKSVRVTIGTTLLEAAQKAGFGVSTLCYWPGLCDAGACRVCVVEVDGAVAAACNTVAGEGMVVQTRSARVLAAKRANVKWLLESHRVDCPACPRGGGCELQALAKELNLSDYTPAHFAYPTSFDDSILRRDNQKCIKCMRCIAVCRDVQGLNVWQTHGHGARLAVDSPRGTDIRKQCVLCGQCVTHCPVAALQTRDDTQLVLDALNDPDRTVVFQIAPAVRAVWDEDAPKQPGRKTAVGRMVAAVKHLGADYVFDTNFAADLTIMEEAHELLEILSKKDQSDANVFGAAPQVPGPLFTSCCPGWLFYVKNHAPEWLPRLSTAKSPQQMFGAAVKTWFAKQRGVDAAKLFCVSVMPCVAKKAEAAGENGTEVDVVLTTRELYALLKTQGVSLLDLEPTNFDTLVENGRPDREASGAAVLFGNTGGVMEAALRTAHFVVTGQNPAPENIAYYGNTGATDEVRPGGLREASVTVGDRTLKIAVVSGLSHVKALLSKIKSGEASYDFVEVMACPGGCVGGGGQPICHGEPAARRAGVLRHLDEQAAIRLSHENEAVQQAYADFFDKPLSDTAHRWLHRAH